MVAHLGLLLGLAVAFAAFASFRSVRRWRRGTLEAFSSVVDKKPRLFSSLQSWNPVFEFTTRDGETHRLRSHTSNFNDPEIGDRVRIRYDPANPAGARIDRLSHLYALPIILMLVAVSVTGVWAASFTSLGPRLGGADPAPLAPLGTEAGDDLPSAVTIGLRPPAGAMVRRTYEPGVTSTFPARGLRGIAMDPEGRVAAVVLRGDTIVFVDLEEGVRAGAAVPGGRVYSLAFTPDAGRVLVGTVGRVLPVDVISGVVGHPLEFGSPSGGRSEVTDLAMSPSGEVAVATAGRDVVFLDLVRWRAIGALRTGDVPVTRLAWSSDGRFLASLTSRDVSIWSTSDLSTVTEGGAQCRLDLPQRGTALVFAAEPHLAVALAPAGNGEVNLLVVDVDSCRSRQVRTGAAGIATRIAAGPEGHLILMPSDDGRLKGIPLMDGAEGTSVLVGHGTGGVLASASGHRLTAFSPTEGRLTVLDAR